MAKSIELIARTDGTTYSIRDKYKDWLWTHKKEEVKQTYTPFKGYTPHHQKNLKRGIKLFLEERWPGYKEVKEGR